jgi:hypothetical protein
MKAAYKQSDPPAKTYLTESKERETNNMKRIGLWAVGIAVLASVGLLTRAQGFADEREHATTCSLATLKGRYLFAASWTQFPPAVKQPTLEARVGYRIFNGDGTGTIIATSSNNGVITMPDVHVDLSYTVNADCTGTVTVLNPGAPTVEIFVAPNGEEFVAIETSNGRANDAFSSRRVGPD